jgi:hypothetical protein
MNSRTEEIREKLKTAKYELLKNRNVVATGIGYKKVAGKITSELSIICSVDVKKPKNKLDSKDLIPAFIRDIPTDVNPVGVLRALQSPTGRFRPAPGGVSIGHYLITAGTLGCLIKKENDIYILSNNHVLANSNAASAGDAVIQPGPHDGGQNPADKIAELSEFVPIIFEDGGDGGTTPPPCKIGLKTAGFLNTLASWIGSTTRLRTYRIQQTENKVDCAIAKPVNPEDVINEILGFGQINGLKEAELGMQIKKSGRTTGLTFGTIEQTNVTARVSFGFNKTALFTDQLLAGAMSQGGDSGSAVLSEDNHLVGLLFAGSDTTTIMNRIGNVFSAMNVTLP